MVLFLVLSGSVEADMHDITKIFTIFLCIWKVRSLGLFCLSFHIDYILHFCVYICAYLYMTLFPIVLFSLSFVSAGVYPFLLPGILFLSLLVLGVFYLLLCSDIHFVAAVVCCVVLRLAASLSLLCSVVDVLLADASSASICRLLFFLLTGSAATI